VRIALVLVAIGIVAFGGFLMWAMLKALGVEFQWLNASSKRLVRGGRKLFWAAGFALPVCVCTGALIGVIVRPSGSTLGSSVEGDVIGGAIGLVLTVVLIVLAGPLKKPDGSTTTQL
jgi:hypothetical protein